MSKNTRKGTGEPSEPSFYVWQLVTSKILGASPDVIRAALDANQMYTIQEAREAINEFMNRKA